MTDTEAVASHDGSWLLTHQLLNKVLTTQSVFFSLHLSSSTVSGLHSFHTTDSADFFVLKEESIRGREQLKTSASVPSSTVNCIQCPVKPPEM